MKKNSGILPDDWDEVALTEAKCAEVRKDGFLIAGYHSVCCCCPPEIGVSTLFKLSPQQIYNRRYYARSGGWPTSIATKQEP